MEVSQTFNVQCFCDEKSIQPVSFGYFVHEPGAFGDSLRLLRKTIRIKSPGPAMPPSPHHPFWPEFGWWHEHMLHEYEGKRLVRHLYTEVLADAQNFLPPALFALFWAIEKGETDFVNYCIPLWSHEERLTGGLLRSVFAALSLFEAAFRVLAGEQTGEPARGDIPYLDFFVADLATGKREEQTGADFGVIVDVGLPREHRFVKACRFQAKKAYSNGDTTVDLDQVETMLNQDQIGYELFYHQEDRRSRAVPPPTVVPVDTWKDEVRGRREKKATGKIGSCSRKVRHEGSDLALFLTFAICDPTSSFGVAFPNSRDAAWALVTGKDRIVPVSRILAISLGRGPSGAEGRPLSWREIFGEIAAEFPQ